MQFRNLQKQYEILKDEIDNSIRNVCKNANFISGQQVKDLEKQLAEYAGVKHCVSCANGTDALQLALMVWNIGPGDAVFVPDFTFFSSGEIVSAVGATPVFVDIDSRSFNMSTRSLVDAIELVRYEKGLNPKAVIAVDLFGQPADDGCMREICSKYKLLLLEDGAQGFGGMINDQRACSFGDISTTSFFPAKPLGCYGDGGAIFTDNDEWADLLRSYRIHGKGTDKYDNVRVGMNSRLDTIQAAILQVKLEHFEDEIAACQKAAGLYDRLLGDNENVVTPEILPGYRSSWAQYTILVDNGSKREQLMQRLKDSGIPTMIYYRKPMHKQKAFEPILLETDCSVTEQVCERCLSLPMGPYIEENDIERICNIINEYVEGTD